MGAPTFAYITLGFDGPQAVLVEIDNQLEGYENHTAAPESRLNENNYGTENEIEEEMPTNDESIDA